MKVLEFLTTCHVLSCLFRVCSNLSPVLFIILYTIWISSVKHSQVFIFADDVRLFQQVNLISDCTLLQDDACSVQKWCISNSLLLNPRKNSSAVFNCRESVARYLCILSFNETSRIIL